MNLQIISNPPTHSPPTQRQIKSGGCPVLRQVGKPLVPSVVRFHSKPDLTQRFHQAVALLLRLKRNKRNFNLVEVQFEKSKLDVGHFDNLQQPEPAWTSNNPHSPLSSRPCCKQSTFKELNKAACQPVKQFPKSVFNTKSIIIPHVVGQGGPLGRWNGSARLFF